MRDIVFTLVVGCPNKCVYCPQDALMKAYKGNKVMEFEDFRACVDKLPKSTRIHFSGFGEPFTHPEAITFLCYALRGGRKVLLYTTLVGASMKKLSALKGCEFDYLVVHLVNEKESNAVLGEEYFSMLGFVANTDLGKKSFIRTKHTPQRSLDIVKGNICNEMKFISRGGLLEGRQKIKMCESIWCPQTDLNTVLPNGDVVVCSMDFGLKHRIGNLLEQGVEEISNSKEKKEFLKGMRVDRDTICRNCEFALNSFPLCRQFYCVRVFVSEKVASLKRLAGVKV